MKIHVFPHGSERKKCLLLVGGSGDTAERFQPLVARLVPLLPDHTICTFTLSSKALTPLLDTQAAELQEVFDQLLRGYTFESFDLFCTSMGAYATVNAICQPDIAERVGQVIFFDPADYLLHSSFISPEEEVTWSGYQTYHPQAPVISEELAKVTGKMKIHVIHLTVKNHGPQGYWESEYANRNTGHIHGFPRLNTQMVRAFYDRTLLANQGIYSKIANLPHGFIRDGNVAQNLTQVADTIAQLINV